MTDLEDPTAFPYAWTTAEATIAGRPWRLRALDGFEGNVSAVYRTLGGRPPGRDSGDWLPMFGVLWPGARALARRVARADLAGVDVLELGCGLALPSLVAASCGARAVATDNHPHAGAVLAENARRHGVEVAFAALDWRDAAAALPKASFPRIIASDLLYSPELAPLVAAVIARWMAPGGEAWLVDPGRLALGAFADALPQHGLRADVDVVEEGGVELFSVTLRRG